MTLEIKKAAAVAVVVVATVGAKAWLLMLFLLFRLLCFALRTHTCTNQTPSSSLVYLYYMCGAYLSTSDFSLGLAGCGWPLSLSFVRGFPLFLYGWNGHRCCISASSLSILRYYVLHVSSLHPNEEFSAEWKKTGRTHQTAKGRGKQPAESGQG